MFDILKSGYLILKNSNFEISRSRSTTLVAKIKGLEKYIKLKSFSVLMSVVFKFLRKKTQGGGDGKNYPLPQS